MWVLANLIAALILAYLLSVAYKKRALVRRYREALLAADEEAKRQRDAAREPEAEA